MEFEAEGLLKNVVCAGMHCGWKTFYPILLPVIFSGGCGLRPLSAGKYVLVGIEEEN
jgi:hypothetical protein